MSQDITTKELINQLQREISNAVQDLGMISSFSKKLPQCNAENLDREFIRLSDLFKEVERKVKRASSQISQGNEKWGDGSFSNITSSSEIDSFTPTLSKPLKSPRLIEGKSQKLKDNLISKGIPYTKGYQAHHIIPSGVADKSDLMLNAIEKAGFDIDCAENGIFLPPNILSDDILPPHRGSHPRYSNYAEDILKHKWDELKDCNLQDDKIALISAINDTLSDLKKIIRIQGRELRLTVNDL